LARKTNHTKSTLFIAALLLLPVSEEASAREKRTVTFTSPCSCEGNHGVSRWAEKTDPLLPPAGDIGIQHITPADMFARQGPGLRPTHSSPRSAAEETWYAVTGKIDKVRVEDDGDLHIVMTNVDARAGEIVVELPLGPLWCEMRKTVFSWTNARFPFGIGGNKMFRLLEHPIVTVVGKAFYDIDHSGSDDRNNRRSYDQSEAVWEIHPVMRLSMGGSKNSATSPLTPPLSAPQIQPRPTPQIAATRTSAVPAPTATPEQFVTITQPVTIKIPYGQSVLPLGLRLPVVSRDATTVRVRYMNLVYPVPVSSTDSK
jgi:hypothetical protein